MLESSSVPVVILEDEWPLLLLPGKPLEYPLSHVVDREWDLATSDAGGGGEHVARLLTRLEWPVRSRAVVECGDVVSLKLGFAIGSFVPCLVVQPNKSGWDGSDAVFCWSLLAA